MKNPKNNKAFTLIELLVVIAIIALISSVVMNNVASARMKAADTKVTEDLRQVKLAAEMYYIDYKDYPPVDTGTGFNSTEKVKTASVNNKLAFFAKTAQAAVTHTQTKLCANFDAMAQVLVDKKYIASIPVHPYDNDAAGICYKAVKKDKTFISYAVLTQHVGTSAVSAGVANKRAGFIVGDTSSTALQEIADDTALWEDDEDYPYPMDASGDFAFNEFDGTLDSLDAIEGITDGADTVDGGGFNIPSLVPPIIPPATPPIAPPSPCTTGWALDLAPSSPKCALIPIGDPYASMELDERLNYATFECTTGQIWVIDGLQNTRYGNCVNQ